MKPYIICHMASSIDGKIDGEALNPVMGEGDYESTGAKLKGDAWICGRTTMQLHFAEKKPFLSTSKKPTGRPSVFVARQAKSYAISVDTHGKLVWRSGDLDGDHLICVVSEEAPQDYLAMLRDKGISYVVAGKSSVNLTKAVNELGKHFRIRTLLLEGGGHINGAFLQAGLVDEVSLLLLPGIDGRSEIPAVFDGVSAGKKKAVPLNLKTVVRLGGNTLWLRYDVVRSKSAKGKGSRNGKAKVGKR